MLALRDISFTLGGVPLFDGASATIPTGHKVGVIGRNGTGKTTLFRLIRGEWPLDSGEVEVPKGFRIGGVEQEAPATSHSLLDTVLAADTERAALLEEAETATDPDRIAEIQLRLTDIDAHSAEARAGAILSGLGFDTQAQARPCHEFSGGWRMRVALAAVLFSAPDLLLLDEPTNYLDLEGAVWLENFLAHYPKTALIISHDRELLNRSVTGILHLKDRKLTYYTGTYDQFEAEYRRKIEHQEAMREKQAAERAHIQAFVNKFRANASKARQAQSRLKLLEKMEPIPAVTENAVASFNFPAPEDIPPPMVVVEDGSVGYDGKAVLRGLNFRIDPDDRIALLGANGEGKSTLSKLLAGKLALMTGNITRSRKLRVGYFAQHQLDELVPADSPVQHIARLCPDDPPDKLRARLGAVGIGEDIFDNPVERLSGGQKTRLLMALAAVNAPHLLILDEPTNHLDIESREALMQALNAYSGAVILVSHDSHLVETVADRLWLVSGGRVAAFDGDMADYKRQFLAERSESRRADKAAAKTKTKDGGKTKSGKQVRSETAPLRKAVSASEKRLEKLTGEKEKIESALADPNLYESGDPAEIERLSTELADIKEKLAAEEERWIAACEELEAARG